MDGDSGAALLCDSAAVRRFGRGACGGTGHMGIFGVDVRMKHEAKRVERALYFKCIFDQL